MFDALLGNPIISAILVVIAVPVVLVGYICVVERVVGLFRRTTAGRIRPWLWLAPALVFLGVFLVYPTISTIIRSFQNRRGDAFVGLENYQWFFTQPDALIALRNNVLWVVFLPLLVVGLGLLVAVLVDRVRYEGAAKTVIFLPLAISFVAAGVIWRFMYDLNPDIGTLNAAVTAVGGEPRAWLVEQPQNNLVPDHREGLDADRLRDGHPVGGLKGISTELLEAARVDGANEWQVFRKIIFPLLLPTIAVVATTIIITR